MDQKLLELGRPLVRRQRVRKRWLAVGAAALLLLGAALLWQQYRGYLLPSWVQWQRKTITCEAADGPTEIRLSRRRVTVVCEEEVLWQSDRDIPVQDVLWGDIDHDGENELMLLCWKRGRYGESRPFWVTEDEPSWSQHIYLYDWEAGGPKPIWMASDIGREVTEWSFSDRTRLLLTDRTGEDSCWDWLSWGLSYVEPTELTFAAVGDNLIHSQIYEYAIKHFDGQFDDLFAGVQQELDRYDVTSINQETPYVTRRQEYGSYPSFGTPIAVGQAVVDAGFDMVSCATNHALDLGAAAIDRAVELYAQAGVVCAGIQSSADEAYRAYELLERNGIRCAVFSYTQLTNGQAAPAQTPWMLHTLEEEQVRRDLAQGLAEADFCIVYVHWGTEYADTPDEDQKYWAQVFADCGADVVIGTHPHVLQPVEWVIGAQGHETLVYYSLGNFISAQIQPECTVGGLAYYTVRKENGACRITDYGLKRLVTTHENGHYTTNMEP